MRSDGSYVRDYIYVEDGAAPTCCLRGRLRARPRALRGEAFNFSTEAPRSVNEIVDLILRRMHSELRPVILNESMNEIREQFLNSAKAERRLGWQPRYGIEEGLDRTIAWYRAYFLEQRQDVRV